MTTPGLDIVYDRCAYVLDVDVNGVQQPESDSGIAFPFTWKEHWEKTLSQAQHELKESEQLEQVKVKVKPKPYEPTKEERQSPDGRHTKQLVDTEHIPVIEFDYAFATDIPGDPNSKISMMVAADSIHTSIFAVVAMARTIM